MGRWGNGKKKRKKLNSNHKAGALNKSSLALTFIINQRLRFAESTIAEKKPRRGEALPQVGAKAAEGGAGGGEREEELAG